MIKFLRFFLLLCIFLPSIAAAETEASEPANSTVYVSDKLTVLLRAGPSSKHKILKSLSSGARLEVLGTEGEFTHVRSGGEEGWTLSRHLSKQPIAKQRLESVQKKLKDAEAQIAQLKQENVELKKNLESWTDEKTKLSEELAQVKDAAAQPLELSSANKDLAMQAVSLENKVEMMKQEIQVLRNDSDKQWFMTGAGVILLGILVGMIIPKFRRHRRSDWSSLS